ncbi:MAG TPA: transporter substrate-binding domain-containing protein, partial [Caulobacteraceae bacterium]
MKRLAAALAIVLALAACERKPAPAPKPAEQDVDTVAQTGKAGDSRTLRAVRARGNLRCGVNPGLAGFALPDSRGVWRGFDVDFCKALAAAVLGDPNAVIYVPLTNERRIEGLKAGEVDVLSRNTSWTFSRDAGEAVDFAGVSYYDGQGFLAPRSLNLQSAAELNGARICVQSGTTSEGNLADWFKTHGLEYVQVALPTQ